MNKKRVTLGCLVVLAAYLITPAFAQQVGPQDILGESLVYLDGARDNVRTSETNLGNLVADAIRFVAEEVGGSPADVGLVHAGAIRASVDAGSVRVVDILQVYTFNNWVVSLELEGSELLQALEHSVRNYPDASGGFLQVSGVNFIFDPSRPAGDRVVEVTVGGSRLDPNETYIVATNNFVARGGDGYEMFGNVPVSRLQNMYAWGFSRVDDALLSFVEQHAPINHQVEGRIRTR